MFRVRVPLHLVAALLALCACATAGQARQASLTKELDAVKYVKPIDDVWMEVRRLLADRGYQLDDADAKMVGQRTMSAADRILSPAKATYPYGQDQGLLQRLGMFRSGGSTNGSVSLDTGWTLQRVRYHADGLVGDDGTVQVIFIRVQQDLNDSKGHGELGARDPEMELDLVRRLDAARADRIDAAVEQASK